jgi:hypothetical protein
MKHLQLPNVEVVAEQSISEVVTVDSAKVSCNLGASDTRN